jgi:hypothetical protein
MQRPPSDPLEAARSELAKLRQAGDWNEATPVQLHVNMPPAARRSSPVPVREPGKLAIALQVTTAAVQRVPPWGIVIVSLALIAAWAFLAVHGKAPIP